MTTHSLVGVCSRKGHDAWTRETRSDGVQNHHLPEKEYARTGAVDNLLRNEGEGEWSAVENAA